MEFLQTTVGLIFGIVIVAALLLYLLAHFLNFVIQGLKLVGRFIVLAIIAFIIYFFGLFFSSDHEQATRNQSSDYTQSESFYEASQSDGEKNVIDQMLYNFLLAYEANDTVSVAYYMDENATITKQHLNYMVYQYEKGISLDLTDYELLEVTSFRNNSFQAITSEDFIVYHPENGTRYVYQTILYTIKMNNGEPVITSLEVLEN